MRGGIRQPEPITASFIENGKAVSGGSGTAFLHLKILSAPACHRLYTAGLRQKQPAKHRTAPVSWPFQPFGPFRSGAVTLSHPLPLSGLFPFAGAIISKNTVMLHQKHINRPYRSKELLLRGNRTKNFAPKIFCTKTNE